MRPANDLEATLATPAPTLPDGPHRAALKERLFTYMAAPATVPSRRPRWSRRAAIAAAVAATLPWVTVALLDRYPSQTQPSPAVHAFLPAPRPESVTPVSERLERESLQSLDESVRKAAVIVVATAVDSAPAPPNVPGDGPEVFLRFRVARVLKGELAAAFVTTRTPTAAAEFLGRDWVVMLSPEHVAGKHFYGGCYTATVEAEVKAIVAAQSN